MDPRRRSLWIDGRTGRGATSGSGAAQVAGGQGAGAAPSWITGRVTEVLGGGWVEVEVPADRPETRATGPTDGLLTQVGALVRVLLDSSGRALQIASPTVLDPGQESTATGAAGALIKAAMSRAEESFKEAEAIGARAREAAAKAAEALREATRALAVGEANRPPHVGPTSPQNPVKGMLWYETQADGGITGVKVWDGTSWLARPVVASSVLVPGSVGPISLADNTVTAPKIYASEELWAKVAAFAKVTTEMLTAGGATITGTAVVGDLVGNTLRGGELSLLDQPSSTTTAVARWTRAGPSGKVPRMDISLLDSGGVRAEITEGAVVFVDAYLVGVFARIGPSRPSGTITVTADVTMTYRETTPMIGFPEYREVALHVRSSTGSWYSGGSSTGLNYTYSGRKTVTVSVSIPEGEYVAQDGTANVRVQFSKGMSKGESMEVSSLRVSWVQVMHSGLRVYRDATGLARIDITSNDGETVSLSSAGMSLAAADGTRIGGTTWRALAASPVATLRWRPHAGADAASSAYGYLDCRHTASEVIKNGFYKSSYYICVPVSGWYQVSVSTSWTYSPTQPTWMVASAVWRSSKSAVDDVNDPVDTRPLTAGVTIQPTASGLIHLEKGEGVCPAWWQNTGTWRPNGGAGSSLTINLVIPDPQ